MKKDKLLLTALAVTGLFTMYQAAGVPPEKIKISKIDRSMAGQKVTVTGKIQELAKAEKTLFFDLENGTNQIPAVSFRENMLVTEHQEVKASGKITIYRGRTELVVNKIKDLD